MSKDIFHQLGYW